MVTGASIGVTLYLGGATNHNPLGSAVQLDA
jgi:hypothetical protein